MSHSDHRKRRTGLVVSVSVIAAALIVVLLIGFGIVNIPGIMGGSTTSAKGTVGEDGFEITAGEVTVSAEGGVAPSGTPVHVEVVDDFTPTGIFGSAEPVSSGVEVRLGDDRQPQSEVRIEVPVSAEGDREKYSGEGDASDVSDPFAVQEHEGRMLLADFEYDADSGKGIILATQLSLFGFVRASFDAIVDSFTQSIKEFFDISVPRPDCYREDLSLSEKKFTLRSSEPEAAWLCLESGAEGKISQSLVMNSPGAWVVSSEPNLIKGTPLTFDIGSGLIASVLRIAVGDDSDVVFPGITANDHHLDAPDSVTLTMNAPLTVVWSFLSVAAVFLPTDKIDGLEEAECLSQVAITQDDPAGQVKAMAGCIAEELGGVGLIFGLISAAPGALAANISGIIREWNGATEVRYTLEPDIPTTVIKEYSPFDPDGSIRSDAQLSDDAAAITYDAEMASKSAVSIGSDVFDLGGTADGSSACWQHPIEANRVVCLRDVWSDELYLATIEGDLNHELAFDSGVDEPVLLAMELEDGSRWQLRRGGSWGGRADGRVGMFHCTEQCEGHESDAILSDDEHQFGYDSSSETWTAFVGELGEVDEHFPSPEEIPITEAWFVR
ncbi:hypothetical protein [Brevibacterium sp.]|uniref:hypothetical protein n=1 Tax=Brevibacterium sp. TaxID=1701 RepID=UPI002810E85C|nr:hypothetical protein [Brevibacterium sp.]